MKIFKSFHKEVVTKTRLEAFSDGVFAIIVTLLVLDIKVPHIETLNEKEIFNQILFVLPKIFTWVMSFILVFVAWVNHHSIIASARKIDYGLLWLNGLVLLTLSFVPFPTSFLGDHPYSPTALTFFSLSIFLPTMLLAVTRIYVMKYLFEKHIIIKRNFIIKIFLIGPGSIILAGIVSWISIYISYIFFVIGPLYFLLPKEQE